MLNPMTSNPVNTIFRIAMSAPPVSFPDIPQIGKRISCPQLPEARNPEHF